MSKYEVFISERAFRDMDCIYRYIADTLQAPNAAASQYDRIADAILTLETMPMRVKIMDSAPEKKKRLRAMIIDNYSVIFTVRNGAVYVSRVLYSSSDISNRLTGQ